MSKAVPSSPVQSSDRIVWIDCEMTGLSLAHDALVEVAALVTDYDLNILGDGVDIVIRPPEEALAQMGDFVREMHTKSGLLAELESGVSLDDAQRQVLDYVRAWSRPGKCALGGNTVGTDRGFLARDMPALESYLHYRIIDVSSIKELSRRWYAHVFNESPVKNGGHRALADIRESIAELRYYREAVFVPQPGPDPATLRELAARHVVPASTERTPQLTGEPTQELTGEPTQESTGAAGEPSTHQP